MAPRAFRPLAVCALLASVLASTPAAADPQPQEMRTGREAEAEARFREGSAAFDDGRTEEACVAFADSLALYPNLSTLLNLALCYETQGKTASAWRGFTEAAAWASDPALHDRREFAHQHAMRLERSLARVEIHLPDDTPAALAIDGETVAGAQFLSPIFLDPGEHVVEATAPARAPYVTRVTVPAAPTGTIVVTIPPLQAEAAAAPPPSPPARKAPSQQPARRAAGWIVGGMGILTAGLGSYFAVDAISKTNDLARTCATGCDASPARASEVASVMAFGAALLGVSAGAWLLSGSRADPPATARVVVAPRIGSTGGEVRFIATW